MLPIGLLCSLAVFFGLYGLYRVWSRMDPTVTYMRVRVDDLALLCVCIGTLLLTVIALWR